jgi:putative aldouronate transport system permease protein
MALADAQAVSRSEARPVRRRRRRYRMSAGDWAFEIFNHVALLTLVIVTLYPFVNQIAVSFNSATDSLKGGIYLWPRDWTLDNYKYVFKEATIFNAFLVSVARTVLGTVLTVICSAMVAYTISRQDFVLRRFVTIAFVLTMYVNGGLIPTFLLMKSLGLINSFWVYIWPGLIGVFNLIIIRSFIEGLPEGILEASRIDGAGDFRTFFSIVFPLSTPVLATVALFSGVYQWNSWFDVMIYNSSNIKLSTLQYELQKILQNSNAATTAASAFASSGNVGVTQVTPLSIRATMTIVASAPIIMVYPFLQKYFVKGMMVGGVKG